MPRVAGKDQQAMGKYNLSGNGALHNSWFLLVSFPSDTGHAPSLRNTTFGVPRVASKDQQANEEKYNLSGNGALHNSWFLLVSFPSDTGHAPSLQKYNVRRAACRRQRSTGNGENTIFQEMGLCTIFCFFLCLSPPTRGTPRLYRNTTFGVPRDKRDLKYAVFDRAVPEKHEAPSSVFLKVLQTHNSLAPTAVPVKDPRDIAK